MTLVPKKMGNKDFKYCFATRMFPLALIGVLFAKVIQMEKENGDWACNHVKSELTIDELESAIDNVRKQFGSIFKNSGE